MVGVSECPVMAWIVRGNQREPRCAALGSGRSWEFQEVATRHGVPCRSVGLRRKAVGKLDNRTSALGALGAWLTLCVKLPAVSCFVH